MDLWFQADLQRILASKAQAARYDGAFRDGYLAALSDLAVEFGVRLPATTLEEWQVIEGEIETAPGHH